MNSDFALHYSTYRPRKNKHARTITHGLSTYECRALLLSQKSANRHRCSDTASRAVKYDRRGSQVPFLAFRPPTRIIYKSLEFIECRGIYLPSYFDYSSAGLITTRRDPLEINDFSASDLMWRSIKKEDEQRKNYSVQLNAPSLPIVYFGRQSQPCNVSSSP
jgi:hypothetical protein